MKIRIADIQVGDRVFDRGLGAYVEVIQKTIGRGSVSITFADMPDQPMEAGADITLDVLRRTDPNSACLKTITELEAAGVVITGKDALLDNTLQHKPELDAAERVMRAEAELNAAIRALPANMYVMTSIVEEDIGRNHKMPFITVTPCQEA